MLNNPCTICDKILQFDCKIIFLLSVHLYQGLWMAAICLIFVEYNISAEIFHLVQ